MIVTIHTPFNKNLSGADLPKNDQLRLDIMGAYRIEQLRYKLTNKQIQRCITLLPDTIRIQHIKSLRMAVTITCRHLLALERMADATNN